MIWIQSKCVLNVVLLNFWFWDVRRIAHFVFIHHVWWFCVGANEFFIFSSVILLTLFRDIAHHIFWKWKFSVIRFVREYLVDHWIFQVFVLNWIRQEHCGIRAIRTRKKKKKKKKNWISWIDAYGTFSRYPFQRGVSLKSNLKYTYFALRKILPR